MAVVVTERDDKGYLVAPSGQRPVKRVGDRNHNVDNSVRKGRGIVRIAERTADVLDTPESVKDWDDEELRRGRRKDKNGKFTGRDPVVIPTVVFNELKRREFHRVEKLLAESVAEGAKALCEIIRDPMTEDKDKLKAIDMLFSRTMGKEPGRVDATLTVEMAPFVSAFNGALVSLELPQGDDSNIIDAEVVEDDLEYET